MKLYFAPMEGITGYIYRNAHTTYFGNIDKYFIPFIAANQHASMSTRELHDILPQHNKNMRAIPQILTNNAQDFIRTVNQLEAFGYDEINFNLGCPSGTVVAKNKGAGFLALPDDLDRFLDCIFENIESKISIKTRIGKQDPMEFYELIKIYNKYPLEELIIHPRVQKDYYKNSPNIDIFKEALKLSRNSICYNGDIFTKQQYDCFIADNGMTDRIMLGRGLLTNPALADTILQDIGLDKTVLKAFHDKLLIDYSEILSGDRNVLFKMKELWYYMIQIFENPEKYAKKIRKTQRISEYRDVVDQLFDEVNIKSKGGFVFPIK